METRSPLPLPREHKEYRIAEKLRWLRSLQGLTQRKVVQAASINESTVHNYELWKDEFHDHFSKQDYPTVCPDYDPTKPDSRQRWTSDRFAAALKDIRRIRGLNQEELAERAGLSLFTLRSYEQGSACRAQSRWRPSARR